MFLAPTWKGINMLSTGVTSSMQYAENENIWYRENIVELGYENIAPSDHEGILRHCCRATKVATELVT